MPSASSRPAPSRNPAVSINVTASPASSIRASSVSRVVPGSASTNARLAPTSALKSVDLPAFTGP